MTTTKSKTRIHGRQRKASTRRIRTSSSHPPTRPSKTPNNPPQVMARIVEMVVTSNACRPPSMVRVNTSRPRSSVPNQCSEDGALRIISALNSLKSYGAIAGDTIARTTWKATRIRPTRPEGRETIANRTASNLTSALFGLTGSTGCSSPSWSRRPHSSKSWIDH